MMTVSLPEDRMPEAEVSLLVAFHLLNRPGSSGVAVVAIDGAQVRIGFEDGRTLSTVALDTCTSGTCVSVALLIASASSPLPRC